MRRKKLVLSLLLDIVALLSLVGATVAWITMSAAPIVSDLDLYLVSGNGESFLIAPDEGGKPGEYGLAIKLSGVTDEESLLRPVSFSGSQYAFLIPEMALDGRVASGKPIPLTSGAQNPVPGSISASLAADKDALAGYVYVTDFWMHAGVSKITVSLSPSYVSSSGAPVQGCYTVGEPVWDDTSILHRNGGKGAENAIRIGFFFHETKSDPGNTRFVIYEPNADGGKAVIRDGVPFTPSADDSGMDLTGGSPLVKLIQQGTSFWTETDPVFQDKVITNAAPFLTENLDLIDVDPEEDRKVTMFVWLEGQDSDCVNSISAGRILANITLGARVYSDLPLYPE